MKHFTETMRPAGIRVISAIAAFVMTVISADLARASGEISLSEAIGNALANNPGMQGAMLSSGETGLDRNLAAASRLPQLNAKAAYTRYSEPSLVWPIHEQGEFPAFDEEKVVAGIYAYVPLYAGGRLVAAERLASLRYDASRASLESTRQELVFNVVATYGKALQLEDMIAAADKREQALTEQADKLAAEYEAGRTTRLALTRARVRLKKALSEKLTLKRSLEDALFALAVFMGGTEPPAKLGKIASFPSSENVTLESLAETARKESPVIARLRKTVEAAEERYRMASRERLPSVSLVASTQSFGAMNGESREEWQAGMELTVPIFNGFATGTRIKKARLSLLQAQQDLRKAELDATRAIHEAKNYIGSSRERLKLAKAAMAEAVEAYEMETVRMREGVGVITDLLLAESDQWEARAELGQAEYGVLLGKARLLLAVGRMTPAAARGESNLIGE